VKDTRKRTLRVTLLAALVVTQTGCTMYLCSGGGPLQRNELGDWAGIKDTSLPQGSQLRKAIDELKAQPIGLTLTDKASPGRTLIRKFRLTTPLWLRLFPSPSGSQELLYDASAERPRELLTVKQGWDLGAVIPAVAPGTFTGTERSSTFIASTRERVGATAFGALFLLTWVHHGDVRPVGKNGKTSLHTVAGANVDIDRVPYRVQSGSFLLGGIFGWGRVNRKRYIQILWIPIQVGDAEL